MGLKWSIPVDFVVTGTNGASAEKLLIEALTKFSREYGIEYNVLDWNLPVGYSAEPIEE